MRRRSRWGTAKNNRRARSNSLSLPQAAFDKASRVLTVKVTVRTMMKSPEVAPAEAGSAAQRVEDAENAEMLASHAATALDQGSLATALSLYNQAIALGPSAENLCGRCTVLLQMRKGSEALRDAEEALRLEPSSKKAQMLRAAAGSFSIPGLHIPFSGGTNCARKGFSPRTRTQGKLKWHACI